MRDILLIDNFDSFTYNLVEEFAVLGCEVDVQRNDRSVEFLLHRLSLLNDPLIVLSPGPGTPEKAGVCIALILAAAGKYPLLGICLGHQAIAVAFGGTVSRAPKPLHGERSVVQTHPHLLFERLPSQVQVGRYHSLVASQLPKVLQVIASTEDLVMAISHEHHAICGLQFHPESILTTYGSQILQNALTTLREKGAA